MRCVSSLWLEFAYDPLSSSSCQACVCSLRQPLRATDCNPTRQYERADINEATLFFLVVAKRQYSRNALDGKWRVPTQISGEAARWSPLVSERDYSFRLANSLMCGTLRQDYAAVKRRA
jgi:hypothetical protein